MRVCMCVYGQARSVAIYRGAATAAVAVAVAAGAAKRQTEKLDYLNNDGGTCTFTVRVNSRRLIRFLAVN